MLGSFFLSSENSGSTGWKLGEGAVTANEATIVTR